MRKYRIMFDGICRKIAMLFNVVVSVSIGLCCISVVCYVLQYGLQVFGTKFLIKNNQNHKKHWKILMLTMFHIRSKSIKWQDSLDWLIDSHSDMKTSDKQLQLQPTTTKFESCNHVNSIRCISVEKLFDLRKSCCAASDDLTYWLVTFRIRIWIRISA